ncbi:hypothetical protein ACFMPD_00865 [Sedimentitalea sp. HM32M-2]|uniref:hypothetical protein n=1 Tax=Sedimentitalea sp. HM32M-2 TaxID=3351566 RepID=UPI00363A7CE4
MEFIADILLVAGALGAGFYCFVLARRLKRFNDLEKGVGGAVAVLSAQVDDLSKTLIAARDASDSSNAALTELTGRAETVAARLELMMASLHDIPDAEPAVSEAEQSDDPAPAQPVEAMNGRDNTAITPSGPMFVRHGRARAGVAQ